MTDIAYTRRNAGRVFNGQRIPFGALIDFNQSTSREDDERVVAPNTIPDVLRGPFSLQEVDGRVITK